MKPSIFLMAAILGVSLDIPYKPEPKIETESDIIAKQKASEKRERRKKKS